MTKLLCAALAAGALAVTLHAAPSFADDSDHQAKLAKHVDEVFAKLDTDHDGKISKAEAAKGPRLSKNFDEVDADHDGFVTKAELSAAMAKHAHPHPDK